MNVNKTIQVGRITQDLEIKKTQSGQDVLSFSIANNRSWKDNDGNKQEKTDFHNIVAWGKQAQVLAEYAVKGQELYIEGRIETRSWDDESGKKNYRTEIILENFQFGSKPGGKTEEVKQDQVIEAPTDEIDPDDIPF